VPAGYSRFLLATAVRDRRSTTIRPVPKRTAAPGSRFDDPSKPRRFERQEMACSSTHKKMSSALTSAATPATQRRRIFISSRGQSSSDILTPFNYRYGQCTAWKSLETTRIRHSRHTPPSRSAGKRQDFEVQPSISNPNSWRPSRSNIPPRHEQEMTISGGARLRSAQEAEF